MKMSTLIMWLSEKPEIRGCFKLNMRGNLDVENSADIRLLMMKWMYSIRYRIYMQL